MKVGVPDASGLAGNAEFLVADTVGMVGIVMGDDQELDEIPCGGVCRRVEVIVMGPQDVFDRVEGCLLYTSPSPRDRG